MNLFDYSKQYQHLQISGDIHGEFRTLAHSIKRYGTENAVVIVAGDCGIGFEKVGYYEQIYNRLVPVLRKHNVLILLVRGNHDDPDYFERRLIDFPHMKTLPDYSVVQVAGRTVLCVGGAISVDRTYRLETMRMNQLRGRDERKCYWENEFSVYNEETLSELLANNIKVDTVISHTAPSFCYPYTKGSAACFCVNDEKLQSDIQQERQTMDEIYNKLVADKHPIKDWLYGHFHESRTEFIADIRYTLLDIEELKELI